jgi:hypothetical protein
MYDIEEPYQDRPLVGLFPYPRRDA